MPDLKVTLVQTMLHWEDAAANRNMFEGIFGTVPIGTDLVVLPEMFTTGFTMRSEQMAETMDGPTLDWMRGQAARLGAAIYGSAIISAQGGIHNRGLFVRPDGSVDHYDKRHLFRMAGEHGHYTAGRDRVVVEWRGWRILLQVCYDLRFPVFSRTRNSNGVGDYDAAIYVANWPEARRGPWRTLLRARAIENQCHIIGVNRVGMDGKGIHYSGDSMVVDPRGEAEEMAGGQGIAFHRLDRTALDAFRKAFPVGLDADAFTLEDL